MENKELTLLGTATTYRQDYAPEVLEAFTNKHPELADELEQQIFEKLKG